MASPPPTIAPEMIECMTTDRAPTAGEVARVAAHIRGDLADTPAFAWGVESDGGAEHLLLRAAQAALTGS